ncbi:hypothetical protein SaSA201_1692 [Streptococcus agalactiae]|nr:hypothetical protein SaSA20_1638b [Streptococcus agalactiae]AUO81132.1 hypothetical protein SaSA30_1692 [Streptococcus agalactiae]AUO82724.1 hypothetical protein SaSA33_1688 [Streptococcus agalactiae]AUO84414.1 hypothetical protein SaSA53_1687 [Streptococcus agalactiae]AUO86010.1 hypothetical protein SaSA73_1695 [Streptococcus agalactiae]
MIGIMIGIRNDLIYTVFVILSPFFRRFKNISSLIIFTT